MPFEYSVMSLEGRGAIGMRSELLGGWGVRAVRCGGKERPHPNLNTQNINV